MDFFQFGWWLVAWQILFKVTGWVVSKFLSALAHE